MDPSELERCLQQHGHGLRRLASALLAPADAEDALQDVWLHAASTPPPHGVVWIAWLRTLLRHVAGKARRGARRRAAREAFVAAHRAVDADPSVCIEREELVHRLVAAVHALEPPVREAIWQRYFEGLPPRAIAAAAGVPLATVKSRLLRGLVVLRERLGARESTDWRASLALAFVAPDAVPALSWGGLWSMANHAKWIWAAALCVCVGTAVWPASTPGPSAASSADAPLAVVVPDSAPANERESVALPGAPAASGVGAAARAVATARIEGRLLDAATGQPLAAVSVGWRFAIDAEATSAGSGHSDAEGRFAFDVPAQQEVLLFARPVAHVPRMAVPTRLAAGQVERLGDWAMHPGRSVALRVVHAETGVGVTGVRVDLATEGPNGVGATVCLSQSEGALTPAPVLAFGRTRVSVVGGMHELAQPTEFVVTADAPALVHVPVVPRAVVRGVVVDAAGMPIAGIGLATQRLSAEVTSSASGAFELVRCVGAAPTTTVHVVDTAEFAPVPAFANVAWGTHGLRVVLAALPPFPIEVVGDDGTLILDYAVVLERDGLLGFARHALRQRGHHDGGRLAVAGVVRGATSLRVVPMAIEWAPSEAIAVGVDEPLRVVVARRLPCRVQVVRAGQPVVGARVEYVHERLPLSAAHGGELNDPRERAAPVTPQWPERVAVAITDAAGFAALWRDPVVTARALRVLCEGAPPHLVREPVFPAEGATLVVELGGLGQLTGQVELAGRARNDVMVRARVGSQEQLLPLQPDGTFATRPLPAGTCRIDVLLRAGLGHVPVDALAREVEIDANRATDVRIDLGTWVTGGVRGKVVSTQPLPQDLVVDLVRITSDGAFVFGTAAVAANGAFAIDGLWPGSYLAAFRLANGPAAMVPALQSTPIAVVGGGLVDCRLQFVWRRLTVRFVGADGRAVVGQRAWARCGGGRWPQALFAPVVDAGVVLDPAPVLPIEFGGPIGGGWSAPVQMPDDRADAEVTVVLPLVR